MRHPFGVQRADDAQLVHVPGDIGEQLRGPQPALATLLELPQRLHHPPVGAGAAALDRALVGEIEHAAFLLQQLRLPVEAVDLADAAGHEQEDHALGLGRMVQRGQRSGRGSERIGHQSGERETAETAGEVLQQTTAGEQSIVHGGTRRVQLR